MTTKINHKKLAIYYGWPSAVNATYTVSAAIAVFKNYNILVFGDGLQDVTHPDHANTLAIIAGIPKTKVYGYIDSVLSLETLRPKIDNWKEMGVAGIFCDKFGYDFGLTRANQNEIVDYIHSKNLSVFVNAYNPEDAFAPTSDAITHLGAKDWYLAESYQIINDEYQSVSEWKIRSEAMKKYKHAVGTSMAVITTTQSGVFDQSKFNYAFYSSLIYGFDAFGWGEQDYSASTAQLPFRQRPKIYGTEYTSDMIEEDGIFTRQTNVGFKVNTVTRTIDYLL